MCAHACVCICLRVRVRARSTKVEFACVRERILPDKRLELSARVNIHARHDELSYMRESAVVI